MRVARHPQFEKRLARLSPNIRNALADRLELFVSDSRHPLLNDHALTGERRGFRSINVTGDWRLIYKPVDYEMILLTEIDTHHNLYGT